MATVQQMLDHAVLFTATERATLATWNDLLDNKLPGPADTFLNSGLLLEHFQSLLDNDPANRTAEQISMMAKLEQDFSAQQVIAAQIIARLQQTGTQPATGGFTQAEYDTIRRFFGFKTTTNP